MTPENKAGRALDGRLMVLLAVSVFAGAGTIHYQTPMLGAFAAEFQADAAAAGWVATLTFGGFLAGTIFIVPLGDRFDKRKVILAEFAVLIPALLAMAAAPSLPVLALASFFVGVAAGFAQVVIPLAAELVPPEKRGRVMGAVLACLFLGILFGRMAGGLGASTIGWRWTYVGATAMLLALLPALLLWLPSTSSNVHAKLRLGSRYSTRLSLTSTSMSGGTSSLSSCARAAAVGAPCKRYAPSAVFTSVSSVPSNVSRSTPGAR